MSFAVVCKSCQARFLLNDDLLRRKVAGKVVTVRCRQCHATIEVDASDVDPQTLPENAKPAPPAPTPTLKLKPAPAPPRPMKSATLMGIGGPPRPAGATELVALSAGFLNMSPGAPKVGPQGFPEPPPPPGAVEDLSSDDWEITETPALARADAAPESLDDFVEELPPSLPPPEEELPSSSGIPSLKVLTHHDEHATKPRVDDFFSNMSAAMNGGVMPDANAAPTIDVSTFAEPPVEVAPSIDMSAFDVPIDSKKTLPLFALTDSDALTRAPAAKMPSPAGGSLSPATVDRPRDSERSDSVRERKNVVAPSTNSVPPPASSKQKRSGLAAPVLLALAAAAAFLIWRRGTHGSETPAQAEHPTQTIAPAEPAAKAPPAADVAPAAIASAAPSPPSADDDVTFETTPVKTPTTTAAAHDKAQATPSPAAPSQPAAVAPATTPTKPEPAPVVKEEPKAPPPEPAVPGEPAGPFDRAAAAAALGASAAQASACKKEGDPSGVASVVITFAPSGRVTSANISGPPFAGTPTGGCIANALRKARVPAFDGDRVTVSKTIVIQ